MLNLLLYPADLRFPIAMSIKTENNTKQSNGTKYSEYITIKISHKAIEESRRAYCISDRKEIKEEFF